ncbi:MAG: polysaccharide deacetylase family protein [Chlorobi bacterium]|nr:polysaccharide deacetylase family protein [Chlorobiota bacterium]
MKRTFFWLSLWWILLWGPAPLGHAQHAYRFPKALLITAGADEGRGTVADGAVLALQFLNEFGVRLRLHDRTVLWDSARLAEFDWIFIPTVAGYHDIPRRLDLTYMTDEELASLARWVENGGWLITDTHIGRNRPDGTDRLTLRRPLDARIWPLAPAAGARLDEAVVKDARLRSEPGLPWAEGLPFRLAEWLLVPTDLDPRTEVWMWWEKDGKRRPAGWMHPYGKGMTVMLPSYSLLHPEDDGGLSDPQEIREFYRFLLRRYTGHTRYPVYLSPWKDGAPAAYCQTFDDGGTPEEYERVFRFIRRFRLPTVFFVTPSVPPQVRTALRREPLVSVEGHSFSHPDFRTLDYYATYRELVRNRRFWDKNFKGFRFPYVSNSFWGYYWLDRLGYRYDSSIAAVDSGFVRGSVVPYDIPIFKDDMFLTTGLWEISQIYRSDWYFYRKIAENLPYPAREQERDARRFSRYLKRYFDSLVRPRRGIMVFLGHPMYAGHSDITMQPLYDLVTYLRKRGVWTPSLNEVADRWTAYHQIRGQVREKDGTLDIVLKPGEMPLDGFTLRLPARPLRIDSDTPYRLEQRDGEWLLIFDLNRETRWKIRFR